MIEKTAARDSTRGGFVSLSGVVFASRWWVLTSTNVARINKDARAGAHSPQDPGSHLSRLLPCGTNAASFACSPSARANLNSRAFPG